jgi:hypothetical protein
LFINNIFVIIILNSFKKNAKILEREVRRLVRAGENTAIPFNIAKTKLLYFSNSKAAIKAMLQMLNKSTVTPKQVVK